MKDSTSTKKVSRREFVGTTAAGLSALACPAFISSRSPNSKMGIGLIGVGGRGRSHVQACAGEDIIALCDVNACLLYTSDAADE